MNDIAPPAPLCPCGSGLALADCCKPYLSGARDAPTARALMRSRYTAYVLLDESYLLKSWHSTTRPKTLGLQEDRRIEWLGLTVEGWEDGEPESERGVVTFTARFKVGDKREQIREASRFLREEGAWRYLDGTMLPPTTASKEAKTGRNDPCPCGSGKKFKRCCGG